MPIIIVHNRTLYYVPMIRAGRAFPKFSRVWAHFSNGVAYRARFPANKKIAYSWFRVIAYCVCIFISRYFRALIFGAGSAIVMVTCITIDLISNIMRSTRRFTVTVCGSFLIVHCYWIECVDGSKSVLNCKQKLPFSSYHKRAKQSFPRTLEFSVVQKSHKRSRSG